ncbi:DoxX family protein [Nocardia terpenica]|uniref:DoxX family protein n=1 Tax=Nocardia terpenica TaxID=455432 RepID=A0A164LSU6_9NOCA|nr:DoxX family protein [Nocardia terpenica]KZM72713.1 DoxX family protein [Nocardia terpenica]
MSEAVAQADPEAEAVSEPTRTGPRWPAATRVVFRFCFVYFGLFCLTDPQILYDFVGWFRTLLPIDASLWLVRPLSPLVHWVGRTVFGVDATLRIDSASGDQPFQWVLLFCLLVVATAATVVWSVLDRRRRDYRRLAGWFLLFVRLCLAVQMVSYGLAKAIPIQMPEPALTTLLKPFGDLSPMGVLWNQVGASQPYEILLGCAEVTAGVLLFVPRTAVLGAMLSLVSMAQVFVLNMTFGVPVKILSGHLLLLSMVLLAPEARRLLDALVRDRAVGPGSRPEPWRAPRARRIAVAVQVVLGVWVVASTAQLGWTTFREVGGGQDRPPLYGIWSVAEFTRDDQPVPPLLTDQGRWRNLIIETPGAATYQVMDDRMIPAMAQVDLVKHHLDMFAMPGPQGAVPGQLSSARFTFEQPSAAELRLRGLLDGHRVTMTLNRVDRSAFRLYSTGFHWVQDYQHSR